MQKTAKERMLAGVSILDEVMRPAAFVFEFREEGRGSGGRFAWGEYVRDNRRLELHFRQSLGLVRYHVAELSASHEVYMRGLGVEHFQYPGVSDDPVEGFVHLAADLAHAVDFLRSDAFVLRRVAEQEAVSSAAKREDLMAGYVGDTAALERMRDLFRAQHYRQVVETFEGLQYPQRLSPAELKMVEVARCKAGVQPAVAVGRAPRSLHSLVRPPLNGSIVGGQAGADVGKGAMVPDSRRTER